MQFNECTMRVFDVDGNVISETLITEEDLEKSWHQWDKKINE